jgi:hypothetical protein
MTTVGRLRTELLLRSRHSARRIRDRRHPANHDPLQTFVSGGFREFETRSRHRLSAGIRYVPTYAHSAKIRSTRSSYHHPNGVR